MDLTHEEPSHNCEEDHVKVGTIIEWPLTFGPELQDFLEDLPNQCLKISLLRSRISTDSAKLLEVHLDVVRLVPRLEVAEDRVRLFLHDVPTLIVLISRPKFPAEEKTGYITHFSNV